MSKKKPETPQIPTHPQTKAELKLAFEIEGKKFFEFKDYTDYPLERRLYAMNHLSMITLNITPETLQAALGKVSQMIDQIRHINHEPARMDMGGQAMAMLDEMIKRSEMITLPRVIFRVMAILLFEEGEDLKSEPAISELEKREELFWRFKKKAVLRKAFGNPMKGLWNLSSLLKDDSEAQRESLLNQMIRQQVIADLQEPFLTGLSRRSPGDLLSELKSKKGSNPSSTPLKEIETK